MQNTNRPRKISHKVPAFFHGLTRTAVGMIVVLLVGAMTSARGATIRLMPVGASAIQGFQSSDGNGYRRTLYDKLIAKGYPTDFVGSLRDGNAFDPDHEGHSGYRID